MCLVNIEFGNYQMSSAIYTLLFLKSKFRRYCRVFETEINWITTINQGKLQKWQFKRQRKVKIILKLFDRQRNNTFYSITKI